MEGRLRDEVKGKLNDVRSTLLEALEKAANSLKDIQSDVKRETIAPLQARRKTLAGGLPKPKKFITLERIPMIS